MNRTPFLAAVAILLLAPVARAATPAEVVAAKRALYGAATGEVEALAAARARFAALSAANPKDAALHYWLALADYRLAPRFMKEKRDDAERYAREGIAQLDQALAAEPRFADAVALRAGLQGLLIAVEPSRGMMLGAEIEEAMGKAEALGPDNPRVALLDGINTFNKPRMVGGGADRALKRLIEAQQLFAKAAPPADSAAIDWGRDDAYAWAGRAQMALKKPAEARAQYLQALELNPGNGWVRHALLPEAERALAAGKAKP